MPPERKLQLAMTRNGTSVLHEFPTSSRDLKLSECARRAPKGPLNTAQPATQETRESFVKRLRNAVACVHKHRADY